MGSLSEGSTDGIKMRSPSHLEGNSLEWGKVWDRPIRMERREERWD
jgi:hypothetical protein